MIGLAPGHAEGVWKVYMPDTHTVLFSMNVTFHEVDGVLPPDLPDELDFTLTSSLPVAPGREDQTASQANISTGGGGCI